MSSFEQLCRELSSINSSLAKHRDQIERARIKSQKASDFTQRFFSDQKPGQDIIQTLASLDYELTIANLSIDTLKTKIDVCVNTIRR